MQETTDVIIQKGIEMEQEGINLYQKAVDHTLSITAKSMLQLLVEQERKHIEILEAIRTEMGQKQIYPDAEAMDWQALDFKSVFQAAIPQMEKEVTPQASELEVLRLALDLEKKSIELYDGYAKQLSDENGKTIFSRLAEEERKHLEFVDEFTHYFEEKGLRMDEG